MRLIDRVLARLQNVRQCNGYLVASCPNPNHGQLRGDRDPSLSISEGDDGRVLLDCKAGCATKDILTVIDLEMKDLFADDNGGRGGGLSPSRNGATVQRSPEKPHENAANTVAGANATPDNGATPPQHPDAPHLRLVASEGEKVEGCTLEAYAEYVNLPTDFLRGLGLKEIHYIDQKAVKMPYLDATGSEEVCVRLRVSLTGKPKIRTRRGDKHHLYGLWRLEEARQAGYVIMAEGESDTQVGWYHGEPVIGIPGATGFQSEWVAGLGGIEKVYVIVEPDEGESSSGNVSPPRS